jgi:hypothetical protein
MSTVERPAVDHHVEVGLSACQTPDVGVIAG